MNDAYKNSMDDQNNLSVGDRNVERLLLSAYDPEPVSASFAERVRLAIHAASDERVDFQQAQPASDAPPAAWKLVLAAAIALSVVVALFSIAGRQGGTPLNTPNQVAINEPPPRGSEVDVKQSQPPVALYVEKMLKAKDISHTPVLAKLSLGDSLSTGPQERKRAALPDGSTVWLNENSQMRVAGPRRLSLTAGEAFFEVAPQSDELAAGKAAAGARFVVDTPRREVVALGTKFIVRVDPKETEVTVAQGKVAVGGVDEPLTVGQQLLAQQESAASAFDLAERGGVAAIERQAAPRVSAVLDWARELSATSAPKLVPASDHAGGALVVKAEDGQETRLSMRKYHVDVHIEDGFARTTIDQTYFNHLPSRQEGTFFFPLPADASISRLAMYVAGKLMEGGMAERQHAHEVFESIKRKMQDPALLEWIDGTTFRMRVFPLEGREEKRIVLSYTQRLPALYGKSTYRFPAGHNLGKVGLWSATVHVKGSDGTTWRSPSHTFAATNKDKDLTLTTVAKEASLDRDIVVELAEKAAAGVEGAREKAIAMKAIDRTPRIARAEHELSQYYMLRQRPELPRTAKRERRDWILLVETSADRDPLLARAQVEVARGVLGHVEHDDTFTIFTAAAAANRLTETMEPATVDNVGNAIARLEDTQLLGAFDLTGTLAMVKPIAAACGNPYLVHIGSGYAALGAKENDPIIAALPEKSKYIGIGVGKRWNRALMKLAAAKSGGYFTQINPDEDIAWRSLDLVATLNTPRLLDMKVTDNNGKTWLAFDDTVADGEEVCAVTRLDSPAAAEAAGAKAKVGPDPTSVTIAGTLDGQPFTQTYPIAAVADNANYLPRMWAKLEIDRLLAEGAEANKERITTLSKAMYVMSPFTSLLVLENDEMYTTYNVDRGRKDHWAMYPCPDQIEVVREPLTQLAAAADPQKPAAGASAGLPVGGTELEKRVAEVEAKTKAAIDSMSIQPQFLTATLGRAAWNKHYWRKGGYGLATGSAELETYRYDNYFGSPARMYLDKRLAKQHVMLGMPMSGGSSNWAFRGYGLNTGRYVRGEALYENLPVQVEFDGFDVDANSLAWRLPVLDDYSGIPFAESTPITYPNAAFWEKLTDRRKQLASVDLATQYYASPNFGDTLLSFQAMDGTVNAGPYFKFRYNGRTPGVKYLFGTPQTFGEQNGILPGLWATRPMDIHPTTAGVPWLVAPPASVRLYDSSTSGAATWYDYDGESFGLAGGRGLTLGSRAVVLPGEIRTWSAASDFSGPVRMLSDLTIADEFREVEGIARLDDLNTDGLSLYTWLPTGTDTRYDDLMRGRALNRAPGQVAADDSFESLVGPVRIEYFDELDNLIVRGNPQDVEKTMELIRGLALKAELGGSIKDGKALSQVERLKRRSLATERGAVAKTAEAKQRLAEWQRAHEPNLPGPKLNLIYEHPNLNQAPTLPHSAQTLAAYAPGMYSTPADMQAVLEEEVREHRPTLGKIDAEARKLIERAQSRGWQHVTIPMVAPLDPLTVFVDGAGRHRFTRYTEYGLAEEVVCDGTHQWRLYAELGLGAKRTVSRYHRGEIEQLVPWLVPTAEDLAVGGDVTRIDNRTIAVVRSVEWEAVKVDLSKIAQAAEATKDNLNDSLAEGEARTEPKAEPKTEAKEAAKIDIAKLLADAPREKRTTRYEMRLVFVDDGRLSERQWLVDGKLLLRVTYSENGHIVWSNAEGKNLAERTLSARPSEGPSVSPDTKSLVVLPLPWRRWGTGPTSKITFEQGYNFPSYSDDEAMAAIAAFLAANDASAVQHVIAGRYFGSPEQVRGKTTPSDRRLGFYVLLCLAGCNWQPDSLTTLGGVIEQKIPAAPLADHSESKIAWLLARELADRRIGHGEPSKMPEIHADRVGRSLAATLLNLRMLYRQDDLATAVVETAPDQVAAHVMAHWQTAHAFVHNTRSPLLALAVLQTMQQAAGQSTSAWKHVALGYDRWAKSPGLAGLARYEAARAWFKSGDRRRAQDGFTSWYADMLKAGEVPLVDHDFRMAFYGDNQPVPPSEPMQATDTAIDNQFTRTLLDAAKSFASRGAPRAALLIAWQAYQLEQPALGDEIVNRTLAALPADESRGTTLAAVQVLYHAGKFDRADALLTPMLEDDELAGFVSLWRLAADLAERRGRLATSVTRWEKVAEMEYSRLGKSYDVATAREPFESLMQRYDKLVTALAATEQPASAELVAKIVRAADRWRALDTDATAACMSAAKILAALGKEDLAWAYATTPLANAPVNQAGAPAASGSPYATLAKQLADRGEVALAARAYTAAEAEQPTNAQHLWEHAQLLERHGRFAEARAIYERIAGGNWPADQAALKQQAAERMSGKAAETGKTP